MKKALVTIVGLTFLLSFTGCSSASNKQSSINTNIIENKPAQTDQLALAKDSKCLTIKTTQDVIKEYTSLDELAKDSNIIIEGKIQKAETTFNTFGIYTNTEIKIIDSFAGILKHDDVINITFRGGTLEGENAKKYNMDIIKEKFSTEDNNVSSDKIEEIVNGLDNFKKGDNLLLFLNYKDNQYFVTGAYQGRFKLENDSVQLHEEIKDKYNNVKKDDFIKLIKNSISKKK